MKEKTTYKYAVITPEGTILNMYSNKDMYSKRETAENNLKKWIEQARTGEKNSREYGLSYPEYADLCAKDAEKEKQLAEMLEACQVAKIKITLEVVA